jgi:transketolase
MALGERCRRPAADQQKTDGVRDVTDPMQLFFAQKGEFDRIRNADLPSGEKTTLFADLARLNALYMIERAGSGHIGSSFSCLDIVAWLHLNVMERADLKSGDIFFSSKGHDAPGLYSLLIGLGQLPFETLHLLRRMGGLPGHPDIGTPAMHTNTGSLGMGISKAKGFVHADRLAGRQRRIFVMTGDGELQEGQIWESLASAANLKMGSIVAIVDSNKFQSDTHVSRVNDLRDVAAKFEAFGWASARCDGHSPDALSAALRELEKHTERPKVIVADTIKGAGVSFMQHTALGADDEFYRFHSGAPGPANYASALQELRTRIDSSLRGARLEPLKLDRAERVAPAAAVPQKRLIPAYSDALLQQAQAHADIVALDGDLMIDCGVLAFRNSFPDRFFECGIAEQDMVSTAGALALSGKLPIVHSFACFLSTRPNEQIFNNATECTKIIYVGSLAGLVPGGPGHSHQAIRDIAALGGTPGLTMLEPATESEVAEVLDWCVNQATGPCYIRLVSVPWEPPQTPSGTLTPGRGRTIREGDDVVVFGYGPILLSVAEQAAKLLDGAGIGVQIVDLPWLNAVDGDWLREIVAGADLVVCLDNHAPVGGQGDRIAACLAADASHPPLLKIGVEGIAACGTAAEVLAYHGLDAPSLSARIREKLSAIR